MADLSDELRAALAALTPSTRDLFRRALNREEGERGAGGTLLVFGEGGDGDYLIDDLIYAINRQTPKSDERRESGADTGRNRCRGLTGRERMVALYGLPT